jgi:SAM-dependent methyltransferase
MAWNAVYDADPEHYDRLRQCWLNERRAKFVAERLQRYRLPAGAAVLELGSGTGWLLERLAGRFPGLAFCGLEPVDAYVAFARKRTRDERVRYIQGTAETAHHHLTRQFQAVLSNDVLHHVQSLPHTVQAVSGVAAPGCRWLVIEPNCNNLYTFFKQSFKSGERNFWPRSFRRLAEQGGWRLEERGYLFLIPPLLRQPPRWMRTLEQKLEGIRALSGGIYLQLIYPPEVPITTSDGSGEGSCLEAPAG